MSNQFTVGKLAFGFCDTCGWRYPLGELKSNIVKTKVTNILACPTCNDPDHPQLQLGMYPVNDPQALRNPRPDTNRSVSNAVIVTVYSFMDGGYTVASGMIGNVEVSV